jgi:hypothetical protein
MAVFLYLLQGGRFAKTFFVLVVFAFTVNKRGADEFICITDIAKYKNLNAPRDIIKNWMRNKNTIELLGLWERLNNPDFKLRFLYFAISVIQINSSAPRLFTVIDIPFTSMFLFFFIKQTQF